MLVRYASEVPAAIALVFEGAFTGTAATGGFAGSTMMLALRYGVARGLFSNEAGLGSAPMVHAAAQTDHPVRQGMYGIFEVFVDTILVCTTSGLVILVTGTWNSGATGAALAGAAFSVGLPGTWGNLVVTISLVLFAYSTVIGWSYYGETGIVYLLGTRATVPYRLLWLVFIYLGAVGSLHLVWDVADTLNGLMALPNLLAVLLSIPLLRRLTARVLCSAAIVTGSRLWALGFRTNQPLVMSSEGEHICARQPASPRLLSTLTLASPLAAQAPTREGLMGDLLKDIGEVQTKVVGLAKAMPAASTTGGRGRPCDRPARP